jgi:hypothetical protein
MSSNLTRSQIRSLVIGLVRADLGGEVTVREISRFGEDLGIAVDRRSGYFSSIRKGVRAYGYNLLKCTPESLGGCKIVKDMIDIVWKDVEQQIGGALSHENAA